MPARVDKLALEDPFLDRRTKLLPCQIEMLHWWKGKGKQGKELAKMFHVSQTLICFILHPKKHEKNLKQRAKAGGSKKYYNKDKHREYVYKSRAYKAKEVKEFLHNDDKPHLPPVEIDWGI